MSQKYLFSKNQLL